MRLFGLLAVLSLAACTPSAPGAPRVAVTFGGPAFISGQSPAAAQSSASEPQPANSMPPGAAGLQSSGPNSTEPNRLSATVSGAR